MSFTLFFPMTNLFECRFPLIFQQISISNHYFSILPGSQMSCFCLFLCLPFILMLPLIMVVAMLRAKGLLLLLVPCSQLYAKCALFSLLGKCLWLISIFCNLVDPWNHEDLYRNLSKLTDQVIFFHSTKFFSLSKSTSNVHQCRH